MSFAEIEALVRSKAPLMMRVGAPLKPEAISRAITATYRAPIDAKTITEMKRLRKLGLTIGDVARACRVTWSSAQKHSKP